MYTNMNDPRIPSNLQDIMESVGLHRLPKQRVMKSHSGSKCTPANRCKCGHFGRYHKPDMIGPCDNCNCQMFRIRPENEHVGS